MCFRLTVTTAFALLYKVRQANFLFYIWIWKKEASLPHYIWLNGSIDILVTAFKYILCCKSPEDGHWSGLKHVV
jgi:hypothetical protein